MLKTLKIKGLRGIASADLENLASLTILVGPNGSAKSTVLEAAGVACAGLDAVAATKALIRREWLGIQGLGAIAPGGQARITSTFEGGPGGDGKFDTTLRFELLPGTLLVPRPGLLSGELAVMKLSQERMTSQATIDDDGVVTEESDREPSREHFELITAFVDRPAGAALRFSRPRFSSALREALGELKRSPFYDDVFANIQALRPTLVSIESVPVGDRDEPFMFERTSTGRAGYPVAYAGDGFRRTLLLAAGFAAAEKGVIAIDEPDAFAHPTMFERLVRLIRRSVDQGTQVIYATHSMEFVGSTLRAFQDRLDALAVFGLQLVDGRLDAVRIPGVDAERRVHELGHDLRL